MLKATKVRIYPIRKPARGRKQEKMPFDIRLWNCECGAVHDRDIHAARNMKQQRRKGLSTSVDGDQHKSDISPVAV